MNCCMRVPLRNCISFVIDKHNIHFVSYYCKYDVIGDPKEVNFSRGAHSNNPCGAEEKIILINSLGTDSSHTFMCRIWP